MKKLIIKIISIALLVAIPLVAVNYLIDPATLFHNEYIDAMVEHLNNDEIVEITKNIDESYYEEKMISSMEAAHSTVIIGSSHIMYVPFEYEDYYVAGLSGAYLGDYYALVGLLEYNNVLPTKIVFGIDTWAFDKEIDDGRHTGISKYAIYEYDVVNGNSGKKSYSIDSYLDKVKELFSFTYFQTSVKTLLKEGFQIQEVTLSDSDESGENAKILPNGRRICSSSGTQSVDEIKESAQETISDKSFYNIYGGYKSTNDKIFNDFVKLINHLMCKGVEIEFYLPSYYPEIYSYFESDDNYSGIALLEERIRLFAKENNIVVRGSYNPYKVNISEEDYMDLLHLKPSSGLENFNTIIE